MQFGEDVFVLAHAGDVSAADIVEGHGRADVDAPGRIVSPITLAWSLPATHSPGMGSPALLRTRDRASAFSPAKVPKLPGRTLIA